MERKRGENRSLDAGMAKGPWLTAVEDIVPWLATLALS